jgi:signal transduction histidine kinase
MFRTAGYAVSRVDPFSDAASEGITLRHCSRLEDAIDALDRAEVGVVLLDLNLPGSHETETVDRIRAVTDEIPIIVLTGVPENRLGVTAVSHGAQDYLGKDGLTADVLLRSVRYAIERQKVERKLRRRNEELRVLNQLTRHDIRNDVTLIVGRARELTEHVDQRGRDRLDEILRTSNHILQLTRSVGDIATAIGEPDETDLEAISLAPVLDSEVETARRSYEGAVVEVDGDVPPVDVRANELLSSVFCNLLSNAIIYNDSDAPRVVLRAAASDDAVIVRIADNGPGIPDRRKKLVFGEGEQGPDSIGAGVGLYLVKRLVAQYEGRVWIEDNEPSGSVFCVELPRADRSGAA